MRKYVEIIKGTGGYQLEVEIAEGACCDKGEPYARPKAYEPDTVAAVYNEQGDEVTTWALSKFGTETLIHSKCIELKRARRASRAVLVYSTDKRVQL